MKIKKTFQGELPENRIVNAKSNSQTDAYSANYLNDKLNKVVVSLEEPTTGEEVWIKRSINTLKFSDFTKEVNGITFTMKDQVLSIKGTATAYTQECYMPIKMILEEDMTLTQYTSGKADGLVAKAAYTDNGTSYYPNLFSVELNKGAYIDQLYFIISEGSVIDAEVRFQLERGKGAHDWQPVMEKQVFVKNENGVYEELVKKNLHVGIDEPKNGEDVWVKQSKNLFHTNIRNSSSNRLCSDYITGLKKGKYTINASGNSVLVYMEGFDAYNNRIKVTEWNTLPYTFEITDAQHRTDIYFRFSSNGDILPSDIYNVQLEEGMEATDYEPYVDKELFIRFNDNYVASLSEDKHWREAPYNSDGEFVLSTNWNNLKEVSFRVLGNNQATFGYTTVPKNMWHNQGSYGITVLCYDSNGYKQGYGTFTVSRKTEDAVYLKLVGEYTSAKVCYK